MGSFLEQSPLRMRRMLYRDIPELLTIEEKVFEQPWSEEAFQLFLRSSEACTGMVVRSRNLGSKILGYMAYHTYERHIDLLHLAVHPAWRRQGIGSGMIQTLKDTLSERWRPSLWLEVAETNLDAQLFFRKLAFRAVSIHRGQAETPEDIYRMHFSVKTLGDEFLPHNRIQSFFTPS